MGNNPHNDDTRPARRRFLKGAAATAAAGFAGAAASGSATAQHTVTERRSASAAEARAALAAHGDDLLASLADDGVLDRADAAALAGDGGQFVSWADDRADELRLEAALGDASLHVTVEPDTGDAYAFHDPDAEDTVYLYRRGGERFDVNSSDCCVESCYCTRIQCDTICYEDCRICCPCGSDDCEYKSFCDECLC